MSKTPPFHNIQTALLIAQRDEPYRALLASKTPDESHFHAQRYMEQVHQLEQKMERS